MSYRCHSSYIDSYRCQWCTYIIPMCAAKDQKHRVERAKQPGDVTDRKISDAMLKTWTRRMLNVFSNQGYAFGYDFDDREPQQDRSAFKEHAELLKALDEINP